MGFTNTDRYAERLLLEMLLSRIDALDNEPTDNLVFYNIGYQACKKEVIEILSSALEARKED